METSVCVRSPILLLATSRPSFRNATWSTDSQQIAQNHRTRVRNVSKHDVQAPIFTVSNRVFSSRLSKAASRVGRASSTNVMSSVSMRNRQRLYKSENCSEFYQLAVRLTTVSLIPVTREILRCERDPPSGMPGYEESHRGYVPIRRTIAR